MPRRDTAITSADTSPHRGCVRACSGKLERERKNKREREEDTHLIWGAMIGRVRITVRNAAHGPGPCIYIFLYIYMSALYVHGLGPCPSRIHIHNVRCVSGSYWTLTLQCLGTGRKNKKEMARAWSQALGDHAHAVAGSHEMLVRDWPLLQHLYIGLSVTPEQIC